MNIYMIKNIPNQLKPLSFLKDGTEVLWWIPSNKTTHNLSSIQTQTDELIFRETIVTLKTEFNDLPEEIKGFLLLYKYSIDQLKRELGKEKWLKFIALHFK